MYEIHIDQSVNSKDNNIYFKENSKKIVFDLWVLAYYELISYILNNYVLIVRFI